MLRSLAAVFAAGLLADVMPHCGPPRVEIQPPGGWCGHHGPRWRGDCRLPAACYDSEEDGAVCTLACETDADCSQLGAEFLCSSHGVLDAEREPRTRQRLCGRVVAK